MSHYPVWRQAKNQVDRWNKEYPVGHPVRVFITTDLHGPDTDTFTRSEARDISGTAVVWLDGFGSCHQLDAITPMEKHTPEIIAVPMVTTHWGCAMLISLLEERRSLAINAVTRMGVDHHTVREEIYTIDGLLAKLKEATS